MASTTHKSKDEAKAKDDGNEMRDAFETELVKKIRNKTKKLDQISDLEKKNKKGEIKANEEQMKKIQGKDGVKLEIDEIQTYLNLYKEHAAKQAQKDKQVANQHKKEMDSVKKQVVSTCANLLTMYAISEAGAKLSDEMEDGAKPFFDSLNNLLDKDQRELRWREGRDRLLKQMIKLVNAGNDTIEGTEMTYHELCSGMQEAISSKTFDEKIKRDKQQQAAAVEEVEEEEEVVEPTAAVEVVAVQEEPKKDEAAEEEPVKEADVAVEEKKEPAEEEKKGEKDNNQRRRNRRNNRGDKDGENTGEIKREEGDNRGGDGERRGGDRENRGRGERRGGNRGDNRGNRGDRGGNRGDNRGRRPYTAQNRNGIDDEGFETIKADNDRDNKRGGYRGDRRGRGGNWRGRGDGNWRGKDGEEGRGNFRGDRRGRGERGERRGGKRGDDGENKEAPAQVGVALAETKPEAAAAE